MKLGELEIGTKNGEVVVNHPDLEPDVHGVGHIIFSPAREILKENA